MNASLSVSLYVFLSRRFCLARFRFLGAAVSLLFAGGGLPLQAEDAPRWNILFVFADDWGRFASCLAALEKQPSANQVVSTPNVDRLAREGVIFRNAFVNAPSCTPCRSSMLSGRFFFNTGRGAILNGAEWDSSIPTFPLLLRDAGYSIGKTYKVWSPGVPADAPFGGQKYAYEGAGQTSNRFSGVVNRRIDEGASAVQAKAEMLAQVKGNFSSFLSARTSGAPWLYFFGTTTTHRKWVKGSGKALWNIDPDRLKGKMPAYLPDVPEVREDLADYLGEVQAVDAYIGVLLAELEASGESGRTLVVVSGDHGMPGVPGGKCNLYDFGTGVPLIMRVPGGKAGRVVDDLVTLPDLAPTFMEIGGVAPPQGLYGRSLLPVVRSAKSGLVDATRTSVISGRERHVDAAREDNLPYPMRALRTTDFLYIRNFKPERWPMGVPGKALDPRIAADELEGDTRVGFADMDSSPTKAWLIAHRDEPDAKRFFAFAFEKRPAEELYDLKKDPNQTKNVAGEPAYRKAKQELAQRLLATLMAAGDPRVTGAGDAFDRSPFNDPPAGKKMRKGGD